MKSKSYRGLAVSLRADGRTLQEYRDPDSEGGSQEDYNTAVRYVEAVTNAKFHIELRIKPHFLFKSNDLSAEVELDGEFMTSKAVHALQPHEDVACTAIVGRKSLMDGDWQLQRFAFAELQRTDGPVGPDLKKKAASIGEVTVKLRRIKRLGIDPNPTWNRELHSAFSSSIPEKALKGRAISMHATLSNPEPCSQSMREIIEYPWGVTPFFTFKFKYRCYKDLQIEGAIPRDPMPVPLEERDPGSLSAKEARELVRRQREQLQEVNIKREERSRPIDLDDDGEEDDGEDVKFMDEIRTRKRQRTEIIDLTDD